ncbi:MAG: hypothetical protein GOU97_02910 [Nanoarchaeota archaeon]|nr:hypothetical protein [Nanoarchaeota archaeon]
MVYGQVFDRCTKLLEEAVQNHSLLEKDRDLYESAYTILKTCQVNFLSKVENVEETLEKSNKTLTSFEKLLDKSLISKVEALII